MQAMAEFVEEIDRSQLRPMQKEAFLRSADCCDRARTQEDLQAWCDARIGIRPQSFCC